MVANVEVDDVDVIVVVSFGINNDEVLMMMDDVDMDGADDDDEFSDIILSLKSWLCTDIDC